MSGSNKKLEAIRREIDALDAELLAMMNRRAQLAKKVAEVKDGEGSSHYYRPEREAQVLRALAAANNGPLSGAHVARIFQEIVSACRALQKSLAVAYLGPEGTFTESAAFKHFGHAIDAVPVEDIGSVFRRVESGGSDYGVVPIENSTEGVVGHTLDMFVSSGVSICGEVELAVHHCLLGSAGDLEDIARIYSHQQSFGQCRRWLDANLPKVPRETVASNGEAARRASGEKGSAAIAGERAAADHGLRVLVRNIEDEPENTTRFVILGRQAVGATGSDKTSVLFSTKDRPGALYELLRAFKERDINMTRIESRPSHRGKWSYVFYVDFEGHADDANVTEALAELEERAPFYKFLGSYPQSSAWSA
ncbi:MAG: prephenate dehydratase [Gammaproteobacteria bacterium]|nr:prephenate dehydratase [Gammaproteobacteria bacterium]NIM73503.1 prephenate dehydratase [Gammaproteobacteria bacterium]NIN39912.1 prephenate dehydratase [Gammaproteobacteria bacterium]NIO25312.1 prephenate dehydratase [Gammaproteobacteria bacterium]NIO65939.1 prephenate dehydratase [Gammaproteobacteria bacterium]